MVGLADHITDLVTAIADGPSLTYDERVVDNTATLASLVALGRHIGPLHKDADRVMILIRKLEQKMEQGTPVTRFDRAGFIAALTALEQALA